MRIQTIVVTRTVAATPSDIWPLLADASTWSAWGPFDTSELESPAPDGDSRDGVGAVRRFRRGRWVTREEVTAFDRAHRLGYRLLSGAPVRQYVAEVTLAPAEGGTVVRWESTFRPRIPGTGRIIRDDLAAFIATVVDHLEDAVRAGKQSV